MKKYFLIIPLLICLLPACRKKNEPSVYTLGIDMQGGFTQDNVKVYIDDQLLFDGKVTCYIPGSLCGSISSANTEGTHTIKVTTNDSIVVSESFSQQSNLYIGVSFDQTSRNIKLNYSTSGFVYLD